MHVERRLGVRLLNRNNRTFSLTEPGRVYFERCKTILDDLETTELEVGSVSVVPRGTLRITAPSWLAGQRLASLLAQFHRCYPEVVVDMSFEDRVVDLVDEGYDLGLRVVRTPDSLARGLVARSLRPIAFRLAASRDYVERHGAPQSPEEVSHHNFVAVGSLSALTFTGATGAFEVPVRVVLRYRSMSGVANAVAAGIGIALLPATYFEDPVFKDVLTPVLLDHPLSGATVYLVYASRKYIALKIRTFIDFLVDHFQ
jgi:DNA-binding transcriptional LysR family regulator